MKKQKHTLSYFVNHLRLEALSLAALMLVLTHTTGNNPLYCIIFFPFFDAPAVLYLNGNRLGTYVYNFIHNLTLPTLFIAGGTLFNAPIITLIGFIWTFHIAIDRTFGYGLRHPSLHHKKHHLSKD